MAERLAIELLRAGVDPADSAEAAADLAARADAAGLDADEARRAQRLVAVAWRRLGTLRALVREFAPRPPKADVAACLHVALAELFFVPDGDDERAFAGAIGAAAELLDAARARFVERVLRIALERRRPGHAGDPRRDLVDVPWHVDGTPVLREPAPHRYLWAEDALSMPAALVKRWTERYGWDEALALARASLAEPASDAHGPLERALAAHAASEWHVVAAAPDATASAGPAQHARVVVLPPCSASADFAARPSARWRFGPAALAALTREQDAWLAASARALRPGGVLVFATRSLEPAENAARVRALLAGDDGLRFVGEDEERPRAGRERGGYAAVVTRA